MTTRIAALLFLVGALTTTGINAQEFAQTSTPLSGGFTGGALAYGPDGTLFVFSSGDIANAIGTTSFLAIAPDGTQTTIDILGGESLLSVGGAAFDPTSGNILVTDNETFGDGAGGLLSINPISGQANVLVGGFDFIDDVAVRSTGEILFSNSVGAGNGGIYQVSDGSAFSVISNLDFAAGIVFDQNDDLVFQDVNDGTADGTFDFSASVFSVDVTDGADGLSFSDPELLAANLDGGFDLTIDLEGDVFVTGSGGLFELDRDQSGTFLGTATNLVSAGFSTEIAFLPGEIPFESAAILAPGQASPLLTFVPEFESTSLTTLSVAVPEPSNILLLALCGAGILVHRRR